LPHFCRHTKPSLIFKKNPRNVCYCFAKHVVGKFVGIASGAAYYCISYDVSPTMFIISKPIIQLINKFHAPKHESRHAKSRVWSAAGLPNRKGSIILSEKNTIFFHFSTHWLDQMSILMIFSPWHSHDRSQCEI
jgi:hypothetical protein